MMHRLATPLDLFRAAFLTIKARKLLYAFPYIAALVVIERCCFSEKPLGGASLRTLSGIQWIQLSFGSTELWSRRKYPRWTICLKPDQEPRLEY